MLPHRLYTKLVVYAEPAYVCYGLRFCQLG